MEVTATGTIPEGQVSITIRHTAPNGDVLTYEIPKVRLPQTDIRVVEHFEDLLFGTRRVLEVPTHTTLSLPISGELLGDEDGKYLYVRRDAPEQAKED